jgi:WD40 repeat protein
VAELFDESGILRGQGQLVSLLVNRDGTALYASGDLDAIFAWSTRNDPSARRFATLGDKVAEIALSPDGSRLAAVARGRMLCIYDTADGTILTKLPSIVPLRQLAFSHDGSLLVATPWFTPAVEKMMPTTVGVHVDPRAIGVYDAKTLQHVKYLRPQREQAFFTVDCDPSGRYVAAGTQSGAVLLFDLASGEQVGEFEGQIGPNFNVRFSAGGQHLWSTGNENTLVCRKVPGGEQVYRRLIARPITRIAISSDESWVAMGGGTLDVRVIDLTGQVGEDGIVKFSGHTSSIFGVAFLPGDRELVSCAHDSTVRLWRLPRRPLATGPP